jgi:hypothetical protein
VPNGSRLQQNITLVEVQHKYIVLNEICRLLGATPKRVRALMREQGIAEDERIAACVNVGYARRAVEACLPRLRDGAVPRKSAKEALLCAVRELLDRADAPIATNEMIRFLREADVKLGPSDDKQFLYASLWETKDEFVNLDGFGWWLRSKPYEPAYYSPDSGALDQYSRVATAMAALLGEAVDPLSKDAILHGLGKRGVRVVSTNPEVFLRKVVARNRERFIKLSGLGYWLRSRPYAPALYEPGTGSGKAQTAFQRIEAVVATYLSTATKPIENRELQKILASAGMPIKSRDPRLYLSNALKASDRIVYIRGRGYWLRRREYKRRP